MAHTDGDGSFSFSGEVWTDARGYAIVELPRAAGRLHGSLDYELRSHEHGVNAALTAQLADGRFAIETDEPHVKVAWRVAGRRPQPRTKEDR